MRNTKKPGPNKSRNYSREENSDPSENCKKRESPWLKAQRPAWAWMPTLQRTQRRELRVLRRRRQIGLTCGLPCGCPNGFSSFAPAKWSAKAPPSQCLLAFISKMCSPTSMPDGNFRSGRYFLPQFRILFGPLRCQMAIFARVAIFFL